MDNSYQTILKNLYKEAVEIIEGKNKGEIEEDKKLVFVPAICGKKFDGCPHKIMIVGRAPNGWSMPFYEDNDAVPDKWFESHLDWVISGEDLKRNGEKHNASIKYSKFWQFICYLIRLKCPEIKKENFVDVIVWNNLFKISNGNSGNPNDKLCKETVELMDKILTAEIKYYQPDEIWFITKKNEKVDCKWTDDSYGDKWLFWKYNNELAFEKTLEYIKTNDIKAKLFYRPEHRKFSEIECGIDLENVELN
jgi:hypothetical protein